MSRIVSDTQELHQSVETIPPTSSALPQGGRTVLERLLRSLCQLQPSTPLAEALANFLRELNEVLPGYALGIRLPADEKNKAVLLAMPPLETWPRNPWTPDLILFPAHPHERCVALPCRPEPACLHCASNDPALDSETSPISKTIDICAHALSTLIRHLDAVQALNENEAEVERLHRAIQQSNKLASLGEISAGLVHELSNPLTSIVAYTEFLLQKAERSGDDPDDTEKLRRIGEAADLISSYARAIISYAKPNDDIPCPVDIVQVVDQSLVFCKHLVDNCHVTVQRQFDESLPYVRSVRGQLIQVVVNLVTNACHAMAAQGGTLTISAHADPVERVLRLRVDDTGPGIDPEHIDRIFEPFYTTKGEGIGAGLGLNIVRQVISRTQGSVMVESHPNKGASFIVTLPIHEPEED